MICLYWICGLVSWAGYTNIILKLFSHFYFYFLFCFFIISLRRLHTNIMAQRYEAYFWLRTSAGILCICSIIYVSICNCVCGYDLRCSRVENNTTIFPKQKKKYTRAHNKTNKILIKKKKTGKLLPSFKMLSHMYIIVLLPPSTYIPLCSPTMEACPVLTMYTFGSEMPSKQVSIIRCYFIRLIFFLVGKQQTNH